MKILVIEDDPEQSAALVKLLQKVAGADLQIDTATTMKEGLEKSDGAHVVLLDLCLPDRDGWLGAAKSIPNFPCPVIVVTGIDDPDSSIMLECMKYGAQQVYHKPIGADVLVAQLLDSASVAHLRKVMPPKLNGT